ncbi:MAG: FAD-dependent oxidoreductase [Acidobacteria bacterium]|nr:FAD-dependent oxidoreductase [Acidobacteriota bacterium]
MSAGEPTVAVVGGGLAGLAAACALSESGFRVTLFERRPYLGGRAASYEHPATGEVVDNCQHVLFGCCNNLIAFYKKIGTDKDIRWFDRMFFIEPGGRRSTLEPVRLPAPLHVTPSFLALNFLDAWDKISVSRALVSLFSRMPRDNGASFEDWLAQHGQTRNAIERFWKPILISALSESLDRIAVPYAAQVVRESMKAAGARSMGIPTVPLGELYKQAENYVCARSGVIRLRRGVDSFLPLETGVRLGAQGSEELFDYAVIAVPFDALGKLLPDGEESSRLREQISHFESSPITGIHLWFDRRISELPHAVLLDRTIQWMFHKSELLRKSAPSANGDDVPSYIEVVVSASKSLLQKSRQEILDLAMRELAEFFPQAREAKLLKATVIKEVNATFSPAPGIDRHRPSSPTPWPRVLLAGDWTATGWPATMEGAVRSGYLAAEEITRCAGKPRHFLVPDAKSEGLMRLLG